VDYGQSDLAELLQLIAGKHAFVKVCLAYTGTGWELRRADAIVGDNLPRWTSACWQYEEYVFISEDMAADILGTWFQTTEPGLLTLRGRTVSIPTVQQRVSFRKQPSLARHDSSPLPWPVCDYDVSDASGRTQPTSNHGFLVGDDCPSFPSFETAFRAFFTGTCSMVGTSSSVPNGLARIRVVQQDARGSAR
jgi:hypothetical protein